MFRFLIRTMTGFLERQNFHVVHKNQFHSDLPQEFLTIWHRVEQHTLTSPERGFGLYQAIKYLEHNRTEGDVIECGVYKGGSSMLAALCLMLSSQGTPARDLWLYDTFEGMPVPGDEDRVTATGQKMKERWRKGWWQSSKEEVEALMLSTGYPEDRIHLIAGDVRETLPLHGSKPIALLRLDTDWYESTRVELECLYPCLVPGGILIIDDYGHFTGARKAVDEYFADRNIFPLLNRLDYTGRLLVKQR